MKKPEILVGESNGVETFSNMSCDLRRCNFSTLFSLFSTLWRFVLPPRHLHRDYNAPYLPLKSLHNHCLRFLLGRLQCPGEIRNSGYAKFCGVNKVHYCLGENGE